MGNIHDESVEDEHSEGVEEEHSDETKTIQDIKIVLLVIILAISISGVLSPRVFNIHGRKMAYANLCSSGVLFSSGLVHLLGEAVGSVNAALPGEHFGWGYLFCALSFYLIFAFERLIMLGMKKHIKIPKPVLVDENINKDYCKCGVGTAPLECVDVEEDNANSPLAMNMPVGMPATLNSISSFDLSTINAGIDLTEDEDQRGLQIDSIAIPNIDKDKDADPGTDHHHGSEIATFLQKQNFMAAFVLLFGLGLHSIMAGFALGASSSKDTVLSLGISIIAHKYLEAFSLGCPLYKAKMTLCMTIGVAVFYAVLTPFGMGVGWLAGNQLAGYIGDIFVCMTAGTFLYISIVEIMIPEFSDHHSSQLKDEDLEDEREHPFKYELFKMLAVFSGFAAMTIVSIWA